MVSIVTMHTYPDYLHYIAWHSTITSTSSTISSFALRASPSVSCPVSCMLTHNCSVRGRSNFEEVGSCLRYLDARGACDIQIKPHLRRQGSARQGKSLAAFDDLNLRPTQQKRNCLPEQVRILTDPLLTEESRTFSAGRRRGAGPHPDATDFFHWPWLASP